jgi:hypothetical protein
MTKSNRGGSSLTKRNSLQHAVRTSLDDLLGYAEHCATRWMRERGDVPATFLIISGDGSLLILPAGAADDQEKDAVVMAARLVCTAYNASAVVFLAEAWMSKSSNRDASVPPSQDPDRKEAVMLVGEAHRSRKLKHLPILRTESGAFRRFAESGGPSCAGAEGRFTNILPAQPPSREAQNRAKRMFAALGLPIAFFSKLTYQSELEIALRI